MTLPTAAVAKLGLILGQTKRRKIKYVALPVPEAQALHDYLKFIRNKEYLKEYHKL